MALATSQSSGTQATTQSPQTSLGGSTTVQTSSVQPGTATTLLETKTGGTALTPTPLSIVNLSAGTATTTSPTPTAKTHHATAVWIIPLVLVILAIGAFWFTSQTAKNTTKKS